MIRATEEPSIPNVVLEAELGELTLSFVGDIMAHAENLNSIPYREVFRLLEEDLQFADLTFANFEFVLDPSRVPKGYPRFNAPIAYAEAAIAAGVDVVSLSNNHSADFGIDGIHATIASAARLAERYEVVFSGLVADPTERFNIELIEISGWRVGFVAVTSFLNRGFRTDHVNIVDYNSETERDDFLQLIRSATGRYDLLVLSYHGGIEYASEPVPAKRSFFEELVNAGVDIVWSHHPHVLQNWERFDGDVRSGIIMHSLGNLVSGQASHISLDDIENRRADRGESALIRVTISPGLKRVSLSAIPILHLADKFGFVRVLPASSLESVALSDRARRFYELRSFNLLQYVVDQNIRGTLPSEKR